MMFCYKLNSLYKYSWNDLLVNQLADWQIISCFEGGVFVGQKKHCDGVILGSG